MNGLGQPLHHEAKALIITPLFYYYKTNSNSHFNLLPQFIKNYNHPAKFVQIFIEDFGDPKLPIVVPTANI